MCHAHCATCSGPLDTECITCSAGNVLKAANHCGPTCLTQTYPDAGGVCQACNAFCDECTGAGNTACVSCDSAAVQVAAGHCDAACPAGFYADASSVCQACDPLCATCTGPLSTECPTCDYSQPAVKLSATACAATCPSKQYADAAFECQGKRARG